MIEVSDRSSAPRPSRSTSRLSLRTTVPPVRRASSKSRSVREMRRPASPLASLEATGCRPAGNEDGGTGDRGECCLKRDARLEGESDVGERGRRPSSRCGTGQIHGDLPPISSHTHFIRDTPVPLISGSVLVSHTVLNRINEERKGQGQYGRTEYNLEYLQRHRTTRSSSEQLKVDMVGRARNVPGHSSYIVSSRITSMNGC